MVEPCDYINPHSELLEIVCGSMHDGWFTRTDGATALTLLGFARLFKKSLAFLTCGYVVTSSDDEDQALFK